MSTELTYKFEGKELPVSKVIEIVIDRSQKINDPESKKAFLDCWSKILDHTIVTSQTKQKHSLMNNRIVAGIGVIGLIVMVVLVYFNPYATKWQSGFLWTAVCVFTAACCSLIPGFFSFKLRKVVSAGGALGVFWFMYTHPPAIINNDFTKPTERLKMFAVVYDTSAISVFPVNFNSNSSENICSFSKKALSLYYGQSLLQDSLAFYRKSDGKIYSSEKCNEIEDRELIVISNRVLHQFKNTRAAYVYVANSINLKHTQ